MEILKVAKSDNQQQLRKKSCKTCGYELNVEAFYNNRAICKECYKNTQKERKIKCVTTEAVIKNEETAKLDQINNQVKIKISQEDKHEILSNKAIYTSNDVQVNKIHIGKNNVTNDTMKLKKNETITRKQTSTSKKINHTCQIKKMICKSCKYELDVDKFDLNRKICIECHKNMRKKQNIKTSEVITPDEKNARSIEKDKSHKFDDKSSFKNENVQMDQIKLDEIFIKTNYKIKKHEHLENSISKQQKSIHDQIINDCMNYIQEHKLNSGLGPWVDDLWLPLLQNSVVVITPAILSWLGFSEDHLESEVELRSCQQSKECNKDDMDKFLELLRNNSIEYIELKHNNQLALTSAYIQSEINYLKTKASEKISSKVWIAMEIYCFKDVIMQLDFSSNIRRSFAHLENKVIDYVREALQKTLKSEQQKNICLTEFLMNTKPIENNEWLYIATTKNYASQQIFKVGSTKRLAKRINSYQTGRLSSDEYYYVNVFECSNGTEVDRMVRYHLKSFKASKLPSTERKRASSEDLTELYVINYKYLVKIVTSIVEGFNKTVENINEYIIEFPNLFEEVEIPAPLPKSLWMKY